MPLSSDSRGWITLKRHTETTWCSLTYAGSWRTWTRSEAALRPVSTSKTGEGELGSLPDEPGGVAVCQPLDEQYGVTELPVAAADSGAPC